MTEGKYERSVELRCSTCGGTQFEYEEQGEAAPVTCTACGLSLSRSDLIAANGENIDAHIERIKEDVVDDLKKQLQNAFKGSKLFKVK